MDNTLVIEEDSSGKSRRPYNNNNQDPNAPIPLGRNLVVPMGGRKSRRGRKNKKSKKRRSRKTTRRRRRR
jgi:hypothetical protein